MEVGVCEKCKQEGWGVACRHCKRILCKMCLREVKDRYCPFCGEYDGYPEEA